MMKSFFVAVAFVAVFAAVAVAEEEDKKLKCWTCDSDVNGEDCLDPEKLKEHKDDKVWLDVCPGENAACYKLQLERLEKTGGDLKPYVWRRCIPDTKTAYKVEAGDECVYGDRFGGAYGTQCICTDGECNGSSVLQTSFMAVVSLLVLAVITH